MENVSSWVPGWRAAGVVRARPPAGRRSGAGAPRVTGGTAVATRTGRAVRPLRVSAARAAVAGLAKPAAGALAAAARPAGASLAGGLGAVGQRLDHDRLTGLGDGAYGGVPGCHVDDLRAHVGAPDEVGPARPYRSGGRAGVDRRSFR